MAEKQKQSIDPEIERWNRAYPKFPAVQKCVELLKNGNLQGTWIDIIADGLTTQASDHLEALIAIYRAESDEWVRGILLSAIVEAQLMQALPFLVEILSSDRTQLKESAIHGLKLLNTREARIALWNS